MKRPAASFSRQEWTTVIPDLSRRFPYRLLNGFAYDCGL